MPTGRPPRTPMPLAVGGRAAGVAFVVWPSVAFLSYNDVRTIATHAETRGRERPRGATKGPCSMNRHQEGRHRRSLDAWRNAGQHHSRVEAQALSFTAKQLVTHRAASLKHKKFANCARHHGSPLGRKTQRAPPRAGKHTKPRLAEEVAARQRAAAARLAHITRALPQRAPPPRDADAATPKLHRERFNRRLTPRNPRPSSTSRATTSTIRR